ncbi:uncharacterized protein PAC_09326 [Phialocephala subalpina]|uniref:C2H2-type domain-containing protein n=1 Tax=Phialocephala subalpina TaxID=576137 RepID=A0A1L7X342_9HELO|nr:uncharacterized protein PAC_09326 [Phialocephala subalpina]
MKNDGYYSFDENALSHASMGLFESQPDNQSFTAGGMNEFAPASNFYAAAESTNEFATANNYAYAFNESMLPQPTVSTYQEMLEGQYAFDQFSLPQATTSVFEFDSPINTQFDANDFNSATWGASTSIDHQALDQTLTDLSARGLVQGGFALLGDTTAGLQPTPFTGSDADASFEFDESDHLKQTEALPTVVEALDPVARGPFDIQQDCLGMTAVYSVGSNDFDPPITPSSTFDGPWRPNFDLNCPLPGCNKTTPFRTQKLLDTHLENIHLNPLHCTQQGCSYNRPFPKKGDLDRHLASKHGIGRLFRCPRRECPRHTQPFGRKDKLREHVKNNEHGLHHCQYDHCRLKQSDKGLLAREDVSKHEMGWEHGEYECGIGDCAESTSRFSRELLRRHIILYHDIRYDNIPELPKQGSRPLILADVSNLEKKCYVYHWKGANTTCALCENNGRSTNPSGL